MNRWQKHIVLGVAVLVVGAVFTAVTSGPLIAQIRATLVSDINNPARQPVQLNFAETIPAGSTQASFGTVIYTVPAGKRLVLEYFYGHAVAPAGQGVNVALLFPDYYYPLQERSGIFADPGRSLFQSNEPVRIYYDPGATVRILTYRNQTAGSASTNTRLNGHLVDLQ